MLDGGAPVVGVEVEVLLGVVEVLFGVVDVGDGVGSVDVEGVDVIDVVLLGVVGASVVEVLLGVVVLVRGVVDVDTVVIGLEFVVGVTVLSVNTGVDGLVTGDVVVGISTPPLSTVLIVVKRGYFPLWQRPWKSSVSIDQIIAPPSCSSIANFTLNAILSTSS